VAAGPIATRWLHAQWAWVWVVVSRPEIRKMAGVDNVDEELRADYVAWCLGILCTSLNSGIS
jgi:hypothetical protein